MLQIGSLRAGLQLFLAQNLILMGVFFAVPLYLQVVQGLDALETGIRMLPVSVTMFITSFVGARLSKKWSPRVIIRWGLWVLLGAVLVLMGSIEPKLEGPGFGLAMAFLGIGMGLLASQLGNLIQSSVGPRDRSEAGGLQYTAQQLGSAVGTAFIGAIVIGALSTAFIDEVNEDPRVSAAVSEEFRVSLNGSISFVESDALAEALADEPIDDVEADAVVEAYEAGQLSALRQGLLVAAAIVVAALFLVRRVPDESFDEIAAAAENPLPLEPEPS
jgi:MFS family permease